MLPVWVALPLSIDDPSARIEPAPIPIPAFCEIYLMIAPEVAVILSKESAHSNNTHDEYCLDGVRTPAIIGVGKLILNFERLSYNFFTYDILISLE